MKTTYVFDANNGNLIKSTQVDGNDIFVSNVYAPAFNTPQTWMQVCEGEDARREMFNHFGDDSSWSPGWWARLVAPQITRKKLL